MPTIDENLAAWDSPHAWRRDGDEWSDPWGSTAMLWHGSILPRIAGFLPCERLLEIAPGRGRVAQFLLRHCRDYVGVDLAPSAVEHCRRRFDDAPHARFVVTDGLRLPEVGDGSIDFAFSWDSLVHAGPDVIAAYLGELARVLRPGGAAFVHHSTLGDLLEDGQLRVPNPHWRDAGVTHAMVQELARRHGLACAAQELVQWGSPHPTDCFSLLRRPAPGGEPAAATQVVRHPDLGVEAAHFRRLDGLYGGGR